MGCYFHGHTCKLTEAIKDEKWLKQKQKSYDSTITRIEYLESLGYKVEVIWECEYNELLKNNTRAREIVSKRTGIQHRESSMTEAGILEAVRDGTFFGAVECDISVPDSLRDKFHEMAPIFKHAEIRYTDAGPFMQRYVEQHDISKRPRRALIGSLFGKQILIATPLLRWYLEHGLVVTKVYQTVQWRASKCFSKFTDHVANARRQGDAHPNKAIIGDLMKLIGQFLASSNFLLFLL